MMLSTSDMT